MSDDSAPLIVSALLAPADQAWLDGLRRAHYPAARNRLPAHLTLFRHLPPSIAGELRRRLAEAARDRAPRAEAAGPIDLDGGVAIRIVSPELDAIRAGLADALAGLLLPQDAAAWRAHVTIQNKVDPPVARALLRQLGQGLKPRRIGITALATWRFREGLWEPLSRHPFG